MRAATLFSGIGAPECAAPWLEWKWSAEIDPFASAVHAARFPGMPNLGDVIRIDPDAVEPVDLVVFGSPCQSFSVAGKRLGLDDPRGNLALVALRLVERLRPRWFVFENVPGLLSSDGGRDFGAFLGTVEQCGYGWAYRTIDAQFAGVPQRRRRVFVVGCLGDWRAAAAVLFEPESLRGDTAPRREAGERIARPVAGCLEGGSGYRNDADTADNPIAGGPNSEDTFMTLVVERTPAVMTLAIRGRGDSHDLEYRDDGIANAILTPNGGRAGIGVGAVAVENDHAWTTPQTGPAEALRALRNATDEEVLARWCLGILAAFWPQEVLRSEVHGGSIRCAAQPKRGLVNVALSRSQAGACWSVLDLWQAGCDGCPPQGWQPSEQLARELGSYLSRLPYSPSPAERFLRDLWPATEGLRLLRQALSAVQKIRRSDAHQNQSTYGDLQVRRLVVEECEALQGLPRGFTNITYRGKPAADGPRYRALGNSMAVPVIGWVLGRIREVAA